MINNFNIEQFLDLTGYDTENTILNIEDVDGNGYYDVKDFLDMNNKEILDMNKGKKFDICLMNPPYSNSTSGGLYINFVNKVIEISNKAVIISPDGAFVMPGKNKKITKYINRYKPELILGNWKEFDVHPNSKSCISIWNTENPNNKIKIGNKEFDNQEDIRLIDSQYLDDFYKKLSKYMENHKSIYDECVANPRNNNYFDPTGKIKVKEKWENKNTWFTVFPYCVAAHFTTFEYKQYSDELWNGPARILVPFDKEEYAKNCYLTIHKDGGKRGELNDFYKLISKGLTNGKYIKMVNQYKYFPYLNFSKSYTDEELFEMIGMKYNKEEINKILNEK